MQQYMQPQYGDRPPFYGGGPGSFDRQTSLGGDMKGGQKRRHKNLHVMIPTVTGDVPQEVWALLRVLLFRIAW